MRVLFAIFITAFLVSAAKAQDRNWRYYSPPDRSFRVSSPPATVTRIPAGDESLRNTMLEEDSTVYRVSEPTLESERFSIVVIDFKGARSLSKKRKSEWIDYLALVAFGEEHESQFLSRPIPIKRNGLRGKEYVYADPKGDFHMFSRGRIFEKNGRIYILGFIGINSAELTSLDANRFLNSFRLSSAKIQGKRRKGVAITRQ